MWSYQKFHPIWSVPLYMDISKRRCIKNWVIRLFRHATLTENFENKIITLSINSMQKVYRSVCNRKQGLKSNFFVQHWQDKGVEPPPTLLRCLPPLKKVYLEDASQFLDPESLYVCIKSWKIKDERYASGNVIIKKHFTNCRVYSYKDNFNA